VTGNATVELAYHSNNNQTTATTTRVAITTTKKTKKNVNLCVINIYAF